MIWFFFVVMSLTSEDVTTSAILDPRHLGFHDFLRKSEWNVKSNNTAVLLKKTGKIKNSVKKKMRFGLHGM